MLYSLIPYIVWNLGSDAIWNIVGASEWSIIAVREVILEVIVSAIIFLIIDIMLAYLKTKKEMRNVSHMSENMKIKSENKKIKKDIFFSLFGVILICGIIFFLNNGIQKIFSLSANYNLYLGIENEQKTKVKDAIKDGANVNEFPFWIRICAENINQYTPLTYATVYNNKEEIIKELIQNGADVNVEDKNGHTPCESAVIELNQKQVDYFLSLKIKEKNNLLEILFDSVDDNEFFYFEYPYKMEQMVTYLKNKKVPITSEVEKKAIDSEYYGAIKIVDVKNACYQKINENDIQYIKKHLPEGKKERQRLFQYTSAFGTTEMCEYLLSTGIKINARDHKKFTALITACQYGNLENAKYLVKHGAKISAESSYGGSCLYVAAMYRQKDVCNWLLKNYKEEMYGHNQELDREIDDWMKEMDI